MPNLKSTICYSLVEDLTVTQQQVHDDFTCYLVTVRNLKAPKHLTESLERRAQVFIRGCVDPSFSCVYDCKDTIFLSKCQKMILEHPEWSVYNKRHAGTIANSLSHYVEYLNYSAGRTLQSDNNTHNIDTYSEGAERYCHSVGYERNRFARLICIEHYGCRCSVCGFDFHKTYGDIGKEYIEVHHLVPVSQREGNYQVDPIKDLRPLCSNCHSMIHRGDPVYSIDQLKTIIETSDKGV